MNSNKISLIKNGLLGSLLKYILTTDHITSLQQHHQKNLLTAFFYLFRLQCKQHFLALKSSISLAFYGRTVIHRSLKFRTRNQSCQATNFLSHASSSFYSSRHCWTRPQTCSFTSKEQAIFHRAGERVTMDVRMSSRRGVSSADEWMIGPMEEHIVHERVVGGMWVSDCDLRTDRSVVSELLSLKWPNLRVQVFFLDS